jgi:hypothetical protein
MWRFLEENYVVLGIVAAGAAIAVAGALILYGFLPFFSDLGPRITETENETFNGGVNVRGANTEDFTESEEHIDVILRTSNDNIDVRG